MCIKYMSNTLIILGLVGTKSLIKIMKMHNMIIHKIKK